MNQEALGRFLQKKKQLQKNSRTASLDYSNAFFTSLKALSTITESACKSFSVAGLGESSEKRAISFLKFSIASSSCFKTVILSIACILSYVLGLEGPVSRL